MMNAKITTVAKGRREGFGSRSRGGNLLHSRLDYYLSFLTRFDPFSRTDTTTPPRRSLPPSFSSPDRTHQHTRARTQNTHTHKHTGTTRLSSRCCFHPSGDVAKICSAGALTTIIIVVIIFPFSDNRNKY